MTALTRGPLRARVYWWRRLVVLGTALALVFGVARLLNAGSDAAGDSPGPARAVQAAAEPTSTGSERPELPSDTGTRKPKRDKKSQKEPEPVLAQPDGPCLDEDVAVTPAVKDPVAGGEILIVLSLRTIEAPACTWVVSPESLTLKITSGKDEIWTSRECPQAVPTRSVVVRSAVTTKVGVTWSGRRSDADCTRFTDWALPGWYHVAAAALAGEPSDLQFELEAPKRKHVTVPAQPESGGDGGKNQPKHR